MESKEQYELRIKWIENNINLYNGYKQDAIIQRFNELRNELKEEIKDLDLEIAFDPNYMMNWYISNNLNLKDGGYSVSKIKQTSLYLENTLFQELINLIESNTNLFEVFVNQCERGNNYNRGYKIL